MSREVHVRFCERLGGGSPGRLDHWPRVSLRRWSVNSSTGVSGALRPRPAWPSSSSSKVGTTHTGVTHGCDTAAPWTTNVEPRNSKRRSNDREWTIPGYLRYGSHRDRGSWGNLIGHFLTNQAQCTVSTRQHRILSRNEDQKDNTEDFKTEAVTCPLKRGNSRFKCGTASDKPPGPIAEAPSPLQR